MPICGFADPGEVRVMISSRKVSRNAREARWLAPQAYLDSLDDLNANHVCSLRSADTHDVWSQTDPKTRYQRLLDFLISVLPVHRSTDHPSYRQNCRQWATEPLPITGENASELSAPEGIRTPNLLIRRLIQAVRCGLPACVGGSNRRPGIHCPPVGNRASGSTYVRSRLRAFGS
jgi:hypothetical protein